jgi:hypothetical protein
MLNLEKQPDHHWGRASLLMMCLSLFHDEMKEERSFKCIFDKFILRKKKIWRQKINKTISKCSKQELAYKRERENE